MTLLRFADPAYLLLLLALPLLAWRYAAAALPAYLLLLALPLLAWRYAAAALPAERTT